MPIPIPFIPIKPRVRRKRRESEPSAPTPPPLTLVLVSAEFDVGATVLRLTFDRAIDIAGLNGAAITLDYPFDSFIKYAGTTGILLSPTTVELGLAYLSPSTGTETTVTATAGNGIVAVDDAAAWGGVTDFPVTVV